jgi:hypothetical protein
LIFSLFCFTLSKSFLSRRILSKNQDTPIGGNVSQTAIPHPSDPQANTLLFTYFCNICNTVGLVILDELQPSVSIHLNGYPDLTFMSLPRSVDDVLLETIPHYVYSVRVRNPRPEQRPDAPPEKINYSTFVFTRTGSVQLYRNENDQTPIVLDNWESGCRQVMQSLALTLVTLRHTVNEAIQQTTEEIVSRLKD